MYPFRTFAFLIDLTRTKAMPRRRPPPEADEHFVQRLSNLRAEIGAEKSAKPHSWLSADDDRNGHERLLVHFQKMTLALRCIKFLERDWFEGALEPPADTHMARLLFSVYVFGVTGNALWKKIAWDQTGLADIKTARKYVAKAVEIGLVEVRQSKDDKRIELLYPTERLEELVEKELLYLFDEMREAMHHLLEGPLPDTGAPLLYRVDSPELRALKLTSSAGTDLISAGETPKQRRERIARRLSTKPLPWSTRPSQKK
jgi:hypothetical protein